MKSDQARSKTERALAQVQVARVCPDAWIGLESVMLLTGWAKPTVYRKAKDGEFPRNVAPGRWRGGDVLQHLAQKAAQPST